MWVVLLRTNSVATNLRLSFQVIDVFIGQNRSLNMRSEGSNQCVHVVRLSLQVELLAFVLTYTIKYMTISLLFTLTKRV